MIKYLSLLKHFIRNNFIRELEFRANFVIRSITQIFFVLIQLFMINIYFQFTTSIDGWTQAEIFLLIGIFRVIEGMFHMFIYENLLELPESIDRGELDFNLTKPTDSMFLSSMRMHQLYEVTTFLTGIGIVVYSLRLLPALSPLSCLNIVILSAVGFIALYSIICLFSTLSFFLTRLTALSSLWDVISKTSRFPLNAITSDSQVGNSLLAPLFLVATLPAQIVLAKVQPIYFFIEIFGSLTLLLAARLFWSFALRHYSSASS